MPVVHIEMWSGRTQAQKRELARAITEAFERITQASPDATIIIFDDVAKEDWAQGGVLASES
jgi:4-oxalocrotonate tautomerase